MGVFHRRPPVLGSPRASPRPARRPRARKESRVRVQRPPLRPVVPSPAGAGAAPSGRTREGAPGRAREARDELFLLAVHSMVTGDTVDESAGERHDRLRELVARVAVEDPGWTLASWAGSAPARGSAPRRS